MTTNQDIHVTAARQDAPVSARAFGQLKSGALLPIYKLIEYVSLFQMR